MAASSSRGATRGGGGGGGGNPRSGWNQANGGQGRRDKRPNHDSHGNHGSRANHGSHGSGHHAGGGRGHGGISEKDKETIVRASRTKTVQVAGDCTDDIIVAVGGDEKLQHIASFFIKKKGFTGFDGQRQIRHFINSCLVNLSNHHSVDTTGLLRDLSSSPGLDRLTEIMSMPMSIDAGDTKNLLSFQHVALPLVGIFTRESICQTTMTSESGLIYATVYLNWRQFLEQGVIRCMGELLDRGSLEDRHPAARMLSKDPSVCHISSLQCAMLGIVRLVYQLIKRQQDAKIALAPLVESLHQQTLRCIGQSTTSAEIKFMNDILKEDVHRLRKIVGDTQDTLHEPMGPSKPLDSGSLKASKTSKGPNMVHLAMAYDPPGDLSKYGPRHDNDHVEISRIDLLPTNMEITCPRPPFLPSNDIADAPHFLPPGWRRQLDTHFRLYREDLLDPLRQGIMAFLDVLGKTDKKNENDLLKRNQLRKRLDNNISLNVYGSVKFLGMNCTQKQGGSIQISFAQPPQAMKAAKKARIEFWERSKSRLMQGSLICITSKATETSCADATSGYPNIITVLGTVVSRDVETLAADDAVARIQISLTDPTPYLLMLNAETNTGKSQNQWFLVEFTSGLFATYRPILRALQSCVPATLPFGKYLAPSIEELAEIRKVGRTIDPPLYSRAPGFAFDLSVILKGRGFRLDVSNKDSVIQAVNMLQRHSTLDDTQASSLVDTLCREVALISGPPGTGKTKIGVDLMRVLLHNSSAMNCGPIVCICYTNHALDQFLEHLLDENITDIVRVGTRSKSIRLENCNLESLMRIQGKPFSVRQALRDVDKEWAKVTGEIVQLEKALRNSILDWKYVGPTIMMNSPEQWEQLESLRRDRTRPEKVDGDFTKVQRKAEQEPYVRWATCEDIAEMERWNTKQKHETKKGKKAPTPTLNGFKALAGDTAVPKEQQQRPSLYTIPKKDRPLEALNGDLWSMSRKERQRLLDSWKSEVQESMMELMGTLLKQIEKIGKKKDDAFDDVRRGILRKAKVIGLTTNGAAKNQTLIEAVAPKIIICEEAGEVLESHILATLSASTQHLILIGDHKQLRPSIETHNLSSDSSIGQHYNLDKSLFERLVTAKIPLPSSELTIQRRMRPEISSLIRNTLYKNLKDGERVHQYPPVSGMRKNLFFMNHGHPEDTKDQYGMQSFSNTFEVNMVEALAHYLIKNGYDKPGDIAILTPYLGQLSKLRDCLRNSFALVIDERDQEQLDQSELDNEEMNEQMDKKGTDSATHARTKNVALQRHLTLRTIDNYQGEEAKIVIITLVRSNVRQKGSASSGSIGFLKSPNRTNVLLSRAQHGMYIVGNAGLMDSAKNGIWPTVIDELRREGRIGEGFPIYCKNHPEIVNNVTRPEVLKRATPNGGCTQACGKSMACGHVCPLTCHLHDQNHVNMKCYQPCPRLQQACQHVCPKTCGEKCGDCMEIVSPITLKCGHIFEKPLCWQKRSLSGITCRVKVIKSLPACEHKCFVECCIDSSSIQCVTKCGVILACGHPCERGCCECQNVSSSSKKVGTRVLRTKHEGCTKKCSRIQFCGHPCASKCHQGSPCPPCKEKCAIICSHSKCHRTCNDPCAACCGRCEWECPHEGRCNMPCGAPCDRLPCNKRCEKMLSCGHRCPSVCGEVCPPEKFCVECKDPTVMDMMVDMIMQATLAEVDVDEDPVMALACGHAATMSTLDGMMEMNTYYQEQVDKKTGDVKFVGKRDLPGEEVSQVNCHLCRQPIVTLLRYGRRIKYGQLSMRMKKHQIAQANAMREAQDEFDVNQALVQKGKNQFLNAILMTAADPCSRPPAEESRRLGKCIDQAQLFPDSEYRNIASIYGIPEKHEEAWIKLLSPLAKPITTFENILKKAIQSPVKQLFDAAVSHLYRLKTVPKIALSEQEDGCACDAQCPAEPTMADDVIRTCILECGLPPDGHGGSSFVDSLQERVNALLLVLAQASIALDAVGIKTGWYWFVEDLIHCCLAHVSIHFQAAIKGNYARQATYSRLNRMDLLYKQIQWVGLSPMPADDAAKQARLKHADEVLTIFFEEYDEIEKNCPKGIKSECFQRLVALREKMDDAIMVLKGESRYRPVSYAEKFEVFRVMSQQLRGSGHWYQCPNGHAYVIADCGMAMTESSCPECGERIGGGHHALLRSNRLDQDFENMYRQRR